MPFDARKYLLDRSIQTWGEGKNVSPGWVGVHCPMCDDPSNHGGFEIATGRFSCWKCGSHRLVDVISALEGIPYYKAYGIINEYESDFVSVGRKKRRIPDFSKTISWPLGTGYLLPYHIKYLEQRGFDPEHLVMKYGIMGTNPYAFVLHEGKRYDYGSRIMVPIFYEGRMISYQGRDVTGESSARYKACIPELEIMSHKSILYNIDNCHSETVIIVEGVTDVWRLGDDAAATFGTKFTTPQLSLIASRFRRAYTIFDSEAPAQRRAMSLINQLAVAGLEAANIKLHKNDPAELTQEEVDELKGEIL